MMKKLFSYPFPGWDKIAWLIVIGVAFGLEFLGIFNPAEATLTQLIKSTFPLWLRWMFLGWLVGHFGTD